MDAFDWYEPVPSLRCEFCRRRLGSWKGRQGPNLGLVWRQGERDPVHHHPPDGDHDQADLVLPDRFDIFVYCKKQHTSFASCACVDGVWESTEVYSVTRGIERWRSKREWSELGRASRSGQERARRDRDRHVAEGLSEGETLIGRAAWASDDAVPYVTDQRLILVWWSRATGAWIDDSIPYSEVTDRRWDREHDGRPSLVIQHPEHLRLQPGPAHRFLWFRWGGAERQVPHPQTKVRFRSKHDPVLPAIREALEAPRKGAAESR